MERWLDCELSRETTSERSLRIAAGHAHRDHRTMRKMLILGMLACGCSSGKEDAPDCQPLVEIDGVYDFDWDVRDGNCDIVDGLRPFSVVEEPEGCYYERDVDGCRVTEVGDCTDGSSYVAVVNQLDNDGDRIEGTVTLDEPGVCRGTLSFEATRQ